MRSSGNNWDDAAVDHTLASSFTFRGSLGQQTSDDSGWRSGASGPLPGEQLAGDRIELADVCQRNDRSQVPTVDGARTWSNSLGQGGRAQHVAVVDAIAAGEHAANDGQRLRPTVGRTRPLTQVNAARR